MFNGGNGVSVRALVCDDENTAQGMADMSKHIDPISAQCGPQVGLFH